MDSCGRARGRARGRPSLSTESSQAASSQVTVESCGRARGRARGRPTLSTESSQATSSQVKIGKQSVQSGEGRGTKPKPAYEFKSEFTVPTPLLTYKIEKLSVGDFGRTPELSSSEDAFHRESAAPLAIHKEKKGTRGVTVSVLANFFKLLSSPQWHVYQYHVDFSPTVESSSMRRELISTLNFDFVYLFDGMSDLKTAEKLRDDDKLFWSRRETDGRVIVITIKLTSVLAPNHPEVIRLLNTQMRRNLQLMKFVLFGRHYFDKDSVSEASKHCLEVWKGVSTAIRKYENDLMMTVDTVHKVARLDTVLDQMRDINNKVGRQHYVDTCTKTLAGSIVMTRYNNRTYRIDDIDWMKTPLDVFVTDEGKMTYKEYYRKHYKISISDDQQPLLVCRKKRKDPSQKAEHLPLYLIPELCCMTGLTDEMRSDYNVMKELADHTRLAPDKRVENLLSFIKRVNNEVKEEMAGWGLSFANELLTITARTLPVERVIQDEHVVDCSPTTADFSREVQRYRMHSCISLKNWIVITTRQNREITEDFVSNLDIVCKKMGMVIHSPSFICIDNDRTSTYLEAMQELYNPKVQMMILVVPNNKRERYDAIKKKACVEMPVHTQVVLARTLSKKKLLRSVAVKIGIQLNCKLGGEAWILKIPFQDLPIMVIGFDSYKDCSQKGKSVAALVASLNRNLTGWYSQVSQPRSSGMAEKSESLCILLKKSLQKYCEYNKCLPHVVFIYRDGVSDGQIDQVLDNEVYPIKSIIHEIAPEVGIKLAFIIVNKRFSTRFFVQIGGQIVNPPPGTIVDDEITQPNRYDFFLVSQHVSQGTVAPTQYNVIEDSTGLKPDQIQVLTYKLTYLYYNWAGTIRVPAPCQYAHKLAFLTSQSLHNNHAEELADTLFYL